MKGIFLILSCVVCLFPQPLVFGQEEELEIDFFSETPSTPKELEITNEGDIEYKKELEQLHYSKKVTIQADSGLKIYADDAIIDLKNKNVSALGNVSVYNGPSLFRGEKAVYYYEEKRLDTNTLKTGYDPFLIQANRMRNVERNGKTVLIADDAHVTTDDYENPSYWIKADRVSVYPNELVTFKNMKVQVGGKTVFWLPYLAQSLNKDLGYHFSPGGQTNLGFFWKNRYGKHIGGERDPETGKIEDPTYLLQYHADIYSRRGLGLGADFEDLEYKNDKELGFYSLYWIYDVDPSIERTSILRDGFDDSNRFKIEVRDRQEFDDIFGGDLYIDTQLNWLSDEFLLEDFYDQRFRVDPQPDNFLSLTHKKGSYVTNLTARYQVNSFNETDERLPELTLDRVRSPLFGSSVLYESQTRLGYLRQSLADQELDDLRSESLTASPTRLEEIDASIEERGFLRAHTWHELSLPLQAKYGLSITPRVGVGYTQYDEENGISDGRFLTNFGLDFALKLSRNYLGVKNEKLGLDGISHILQPYANLSVLEVSGVDSVTNPVDFLTPVTRPRPVNVGRYSAIDVLDDWSIFRAGFRQTFLTKRNGTNHTWLYWDTYTDFLLGDQDTANSFSNLYTEISWEPLPWASFSLEGQFPVAESANEFRELFLSSTFLLNRSTELSVGYSFLENHPIIEDDSNQINYQLYHRVNDRWGVGMEHRWQFDDQTLEYQEYSVSRNFKSWIISGEFFRRDFRLREEIGFSVGFTLRDFPDISLPVSFEQQ